MRNSIITLPFYRPVKHLFYLTILLLPLTLSAQQTTVIKNRLAQNVTERITVLKSDKNIKEGLYQAITGDNIALASGSYTNNVKNGIWNFYDPHAHLLQRYDYTNKQLLFEAPEDTSSNCRYIVDYPLTDTDRVTKPVKIGDRYYGYINYLKLFKMPSDMPQMNYDAVTATVELLVSPGGRLADFTVHLESLGYDQRLGVNRDLLSEEDKTFIPATLNSKPILCRILIRCFLTGGGRLDFD